MINWYVFYFQFAWFFVFYVFVIITRINGVFIIPDVGRLESTAVWRVRTDRRPTASTRLRIYSMVMTKKHTRTAHKFLLLAQSISRSWIKSILGNNKIPLVTNLVCNGLNTGLTITERLVNQKELDSRYYFKLNCNTCIFLISLKLSKLLFRFFIFFTMSNVCCNTGILMERFLNT